MSKSEKQSFLTENILKQGYPAEKFINFLESRRDEGSNVDNWTLEELKKLVVEFKEAQAQDCPPEEEIEEIIPTRVQRIRTFGAGDGFRYDSSESEDEEEEKKKDEEEKNFIKDEWDHDKYKSKDNQEKELTNQAGDQGDQNKDEEDQEEGSNEQFQQDQQNDEEENENDKSAEIKSDRYYSRKDVKAFDKTELVGKKNVEIEVSNPQIVKTGILQNNYTVFTVVTKPMDWIVKRRYSDFEWLHTSLQKRFSAHYVRL